MPIGQGSPIDRSSLHLPCPFGIRFPNTLPWWRSAVNARELSQLPGAEIVETMTNPLLRSRHDGDLPNLATVLTRVHRAHGYPVNLPADPAEWLSPEGQVGAWVAVQDQQAVGHVCLASSADDGDPSFWVERLFVDPGTSGHGLGRRLLAVAVEAAAQRNIPVRLEVADNCTAAIGLYQRLDWTLEGTEPISWGKNLATSVLRFRPPARPTRRPLK